MVKKHSKIMNLVLKKKDCILMEGFTSYSTCGVLFLNVNLIFENNSFAG